MSEPRVTVITPCFGDAATLPTALSSLQGQTMGDWECIVVDDGTGAAVERAVEECDDPRFRVISFADNRGRSLARQAALDEARGQFVSMLDADDWYYPRKLERQLEVLEDRPALAAVSCGVAVIDEDGELSGIRCAPVEGLQIRRGRPYRLPRDVFFPAILIRRQAIGDERFDPRLERCEDRHFLMRVLAGRRYGLMHEILYAYREVWSDESMGEALIGFRDQRRVLRDNIGRAPLAVGRQYALALVKTGLYGGARKLGRGKWLFERRNREATDEETARFESVQRQLNLRLSPRNRA